MRKKKNVDFTRKAGDGYEIVTAKTVPKEWSFLRLKPPR
jgi:hypothetical protein